jgi:hypothetical protein
MHQQMATSAQRMRHAEIAFIKTHLAQKFLPELMTTVRASRRCRPFWPAVADRRASRVTKLPKNIAREPRLADKRPIDARIGGRLCCNRISCDSQPLKVLDRRTYPAVARACESRPMIA